MVQQIYLLRDTVAKTYVRSFDSSNDGTAVRYTVDMYGKQPHYSDLELWRAGIGYDVETGELISADKAVIALPVQPVEPSIDKQVNLAK